MQQLNAPFHTPCYQKAMVVVEQLNVVHNFHYKNTAGKVSMILTHSPGYGVILKQRSYGLQVPTFK